MSDNADRCVVTGASGFLGRRLTLRLASVGATVQPWSRSGEGMTRLDLFDRAAVESALRDFRPDVVFHLAAAGVHPRRVNEPATVAENVALTENVLEGASACSSVRAVVLAGSMAEYGDATAALREDSPCAPTTAYGIGKLASTRAALSSDGAFSVRVARLFGIYGPGEAPHRLFPSLLTGLAAGRAVALSDGAQRRDFVHVDDACDALVRLARLAEPARLVVNVGTGVAPSIREVCEWIADALGAPRRLLSFGDRPRSPGDAGLLLADTARCRATLGWVPPQRLLPKLDVARLFGALSAAKPDNP